MAVRVQVEDFDVGREIAALRARRADIGAVVAFVGLVRDLNEGETVRGLRLEHYPGMTERALADIIEQARSRWPIQETLVVHRVGDLQPQDQIVLAAVASVHRQDAFDACAFIMDYLKTEAPFWKKEQTPSGARWVEARASDAAARARWEQGH